MCLLAIENCKALFDATQVGDYQKVKQLLEQGAHPDGHWNNQTVSFADFCKSQNQDSITPLCIACKKGHLGIIQLLLDHGASKHIILENGKTHYLIDAVTAKGDTLSMNARMWIFKLVNNFLRYQ